MIFQELKGLTRICTDDTDFEAGNKNEDGYQDLFSFIGQRAGSSRYYVFGSG
jgi:hypothetical protein